jgi:hypothetical protein
LIQARRQGKRAVQLPPAAAIHREFNRQRGESLPFLRVRELIQALVEQVEPELRTGQVEEHLEVVASDTPRVGLVGQPLALELRLLEQFGEPVDLGSDRRLGGFRLEEPQLGVAFVALGRKLVELVELVEAALLDPGQPPRRFVLSLLLASNRLDQEGGISERPGHPLPHQRIHAPPARTGRGDARLRRQGRSMDRPDPGNVAALVLVVAIAPVDRPHGRAAPAAADEPASQQKQLRVLRALRAARRGFALLSCLNRVPDACARSSGEQSIKWLPQRAARAYRQLTSGRSPIGCRSCFSSEPGPTDPG